MQGSAARRCTTWRQHGAIKYANASCVDGHVDTFLETSGRACFERCGAPLNRSSECYMECYFNTLVGDPALNLSAARRFGDAGFEVSFWRRTSAIGNSERVYLGYIRMLIGRN